MELHRGRAQSVDDTCDCGKKVNKRAGVVDKPVHKRNSTTRTRLEIPGAHHSAQSLSLLESILISSLDRCMKSRVKKVIIIF